MDASQNPTNARACIVTGGSGFIGTHLLRRLLLDESWQAIHVLDLNPPQVTDSRIFYHAVDLRRPLGLELDVPGGTCFHLAAICKEPGFPWHEYFSSNHVGTLHTCRFAERCGIDNMVYTSTEMVFQAGERENFENSLTAPDTAYGMSKLLGELEVFRWQALADGRRIRIVRPGVVFGLGENGNFTRLYHAIRRHLFFYIGRKTTIKSWIYVKDVVGFLLALSEDSGQREVFNLTYPKPTSISEICQTMCKVFGFSERIPVVPYRLALLGGYLFEWLNAIGMLKSAVHHRRIEKLYYSTHMNADALASIGFTPKYDLAAALRDWHRECDYTHLY
ncbi:NAD-dependent epimerase/dehydratase family protein [Halochromatium glycolicum]|uniref:NAD-dependent epimerase/dehydratase domain-containing protein n=1 Tax=Halochromatium glycolicum TaxID=85075 RepID=A0AAJ0X7L3_9GAMM|nr:NAD(P)-dependent oxidoreductase [Halochromatium glycolicum]MBK1703161.1 hypothetical protein [Halochromatium glycolicum]